MATPPPDEDRARRVQRMNFTIHHLLVTLVNLLNLPLQRGTYIPRRSTRLTVLTRHMDHLKLLKDELDAEDEGAVRAYLVPLKSLLFEIQFLLAQEPDLHRNPEFFEDFERLERLLYDASGVADFGELADRAYRLAILLPFYEHLDALEMRRRQAADFMERRGGE